MTLTKGNVIVENIKIGDIHYEFEYGMGIKCEVQNLKIKQICQTKNKTAFLPNPCYGQYGLLIRNYQNENK